MQNRQLLLRHLRPTIKKRSERGTKARHQKSEPSGSARRRRRRRRRKGENPKRRRMRMMTANRC
jgi:hypothetical protein